MAQTVGRSPATVGYRIRHGNVVGLVAMPYVTGLTGRGGVRVVYDDGTEDDLFLDPSATTTAGTAALAITKQAAKDGWILDGFTGFGLAGTSRAVAGYGQLLILADVNANRTIAEIGSGFFGAFMGVKPGFFISNDFQATWVFQGTVLEDATAGTHVCSLTVTPGAGNEMIVLSVRFVAGGGAANLVTLVVDDGTNILQRWSNAISLASGSELNWPSSSNAAAGNPFQGLTGQNIVSGTMRLVLSVSTATVSLTHTFSCTCRIKGAPPTATLADTVGTPVLTTNTNAVFG